MSKNIEGIVYKISYNDRFVKDVICYVGVTCSSLADKYKKDLDNYYLWIDNKIFYEFNFFLLFILCTLLFNADRPDFLLNELFPVFFPVYIRFHLHIF